MPRKSHRAKLESTYTTKIVLPGAPTNIALAEGEDKIPTFSGLAYSGAPVSGRTANPRLDADYVMDLAGMTSAPNVPANLFHKSDQLVGHLTDKRVQSDGLYVEGVLSVEGPDQHRVASGARNGFKWETSIEAAMGDVRKVPKGQKVTVNGRTLSGPLYVFSRSELTGIAFVSRGADKGNHVTIAASAAGETDTMNELEQLAASLGIDLDHATDEQKARLQAIVDLEAGDDDPPPTKPKKPAKKDRINFSALAEAERKENERQETIKALGLAKMKEHPMFIDQIENMVQLAIDSQAPTEQFELQLLRELRPQPGQFSSRMQGQSDPKVIEAAMSMAVGLPNIEKHYAPETLEAVDRVGLRNFSLQGMLMQIAHANGYTCRPGERIHIGNLRTVLEYCFPPVHARLSGFSTINLPGILGSVANKEILAGYMEEDQTWMEIATVKNVSNFHTHTSYRMLDNLEYEELGPGGQIKHGTLGQESYTRKAKTYAKMLGITREDIINDDLGAFDDIRERLGRGAAKKFNNIFWTAFMDNSSFFTAAKTNFIEGATTNLGTDGVGLELGIKAYREMKSPSADGSKRMGVAAGRPTILLVPPGLEFTARKLWQSSNIQSGATAGMPDANIHAGLYRPVVQDRLSDSAFTGNSTTAWYLFGNSLKPMVVSFLNGNRTPIVESTAADFDQLGIQFRGYHDFGSDKSEYLAGIKSKGAA